MRILLFFLLFFAACGQDDLPSGVLPPDKTKAVLYDVIRADEWADFSQMQDSTFRLLSRRTALYDSVFQIHGVSKEQYRNTVRFYQGRPDLLKELLADLKVRSDLAIAPKPAADSVKKVQLR